MRNLTLTTCFLLLSIQLVTAQSQTLVWRKCLGGTKRDVANDVLLNSDGSMIVVGNSNSNDGNVTGHHGDATTSDGWITKLDTAGNLLWQKSVGGAANDFLNTVIATDDGGYLCTGYTYSNDGDVIGNHGMADVWAVKIDNSGGLIWSKCYGGAQMDTSVDAVRLYDGQFALIGSTNSVDGNVLTGIANNTAYDIWVIKLNKANGNLMWERVINYGDSTLSDGGLNITEVNNRIIAFADGSYKSIFYAYAGDPGSYRQYHAGRLYNLDETNGTATFLRNIGGSLDMVMSKSNSGLNFMYDAAYDQPNPGNCTDRQRNFLTLDFNLNTIRSSSWQTTSCISWPSSNTYYIYFVSTGHGMISKSNGNFLWAGFYEPFATIYRPLAYISDFGTFGDGSGNKNDIFKSVKEFSSGDEFIVAGQTTNGRIDDTLPSPADYHGDLDFWVLKFQSLNTIQGNFYIDYNNNNVKDAGEPPFKSAIAKTIKQNATGSWWTYPVNGLSQTTVALGTYKTTASVLKPYYTFASDTTTNTFTTYKNTVTINYPVHPIPGSRDYSIYISPMSAIRPGFNVSYNLTYSNAAIDTLINKQVKFVKDSHLQFVSSVPAHTSIVGDTITWNIARLVPDSTGHIYVYLQADVIPVIQLGDTIRVSASIDSTGDLVKNNNISSSVQIVTGSFDPNDKQENFGGAMSVSEAAVGKSLTYTIRFQNTGNDTAFNITVRDTLSALLDSTSFEMINASHNYKINIKDGKYITWQFTDIKLLDSGHNEPLSHGYITYSIKPKLPVAIGDIITNTAAIYFDYNPPIITNTSATEIKGTPTNASWTGAVNTAWEEPLNWNNSQVPDVNTIVTIPAGVPNYPVVNSNATCYRISVMPSATVLVKTGFKLKVNAKN